MARLAALNLIAVLEVYLIVSFIVSIRLRYRQYQAIIGIVLTAPNRWPRLIQLLTQHRSLFLTWPVLLPVAVTFLLMLIHSLAYNFIWPAAQVTPSDLGRHPVALGLVGLSAAAMLLLDFDAVFNVGRFDRPALEKDLDQAEYWLRSWVAPALNVLTFGLLDPRRIVNDEVRKALTGAGHELNRMMWRWSLQIGLRLVFGLSLWLTWAILVRSS